MANNNYYNHLDSLKDDIYYPNKNYSKVTDNKDTEYNHLDSLKDSVYNPSKTDPDGTDGIGEVYNPNKVMKAKKGAIDVGDIMKKHGSVSIGSVASIAKHDIEYDHMVSLQVEVTPEKENKKGKYIDDGMSL